MENGTLLPRAANIAAFTSADDVWPPSPACPTRGCRRRPQSSAPARRHPHVSPGARTPAPARSLVPRREAPGQTRAVSSSSTSVPLLLFSLPAVLVPTPSFSSGFSPPHFIPLTFVDGATDRLSALVSPDETSCTSSLFPLTNPPVLLISSACPSLFCFPLMFPEHRPPPLYLLL